jgi:Icc protein
MRKVLAAKPDVLVMHHGPDAERGELRGHPLIRRALDDSDGLLVICGHVYWREPLAMVRGGAQALNVDGRVVVLRRQPARQ